MENHKQGDTKKSTVIGKCETLDEGTFAFMRWLSSNDKTSYDNPIILRKFVNDKHTIMYDTQLNAEIDVKITEGAPYCQFCKSADCAHVGFAICIEQLYGHRRGNGKEETVEDIIGV